MSNSEDTRLAALHSYGILDTPPEAAFDRIVSLLSRMLSVPISIISLVDQDRVWFKARLGIECREINREISFCTHTIKNDELMVVPDTLQDVRFSDSRLVTGPPYIRFYAGMPLRAQDGSNIGTLCAVDHEPRQMAPEDLQALRDLASLCEDELHLRLAILDRTRLTEAVQHINVGVVITDPHQPDNPIIYSNHAFTKMTGYTQEEVLGRNCRFLQGATPDPSVLGKISAALREHEYFEGIVLNLRKNGDHFWNELTIAPVYGGDGRLVNFVGLQHDVTERIRSEQELRRSVQRLEELERLRDNLTHMVVHDMRSPLTATLGYLEILEYDAADHLQEEELNFIRSASQNAHQINDIISLLMDITRIEAQNDAVKLERNDLVSLCYQAVQNQLRWVEPSRISCSLPSAPCVVSCDAELLIRIVQNLIAHRIKSSASDTLVQLNIQDDQDSYRIILTDQGAVTSEENQQHIFERFPPLSSAASANSVGLELAFCKLAIEAQGGSIGVESVADRGNTFWLVLPKSGECAA